MTDTGVIISSEDFRKTRSRVVLDYTSRDFAAIRAQLIGLAKGFMPEWETAGEAGDFGTLLLELFAYMGDVMHFYIDRTASEAFLGTAVRRQSVLYIADMLGYKPIGQQAASVLLSFSMATNAAEALGLTGSEASNYSMTLPAGTRVTNTTNATGTQIIFETDVDVTLRPGDTAITVFATEGVTVYNEGLGNSKGVPNSTFLLPNKGVITGTVMVTTREGGNVVQWASISDISLARPTQSAFTTYLDDEGLTFIVFGDNASGRIPPFGSELFVSYRYGVGAAANDLAVSTLTTLVPPTDVETWGISVTNGAQPVGGADPESVESMRFSIPRSTGRLKSRAVTLNDYADIALQVPGVAKAIAYGTLYTAVHVRVAPVGGGNSNDAYMVRLNAAVEAHLADKVLVGTHVFAEPNVVADLWLDTYVRVTVHVQAAYNRTQVRKTVEQTVRALFAFDNTDFGSRISLGQVYRACLTVSGVEWAEVKWLATTPPLNPSQEVNLENDDDLRSGHIVDIVPDDIHIVKINATSVIEDENLWTNWNGMTLTEEERTHDGLWVKAMGGITAT
jgi:baseplate J-like protein